MSEKRYFKIFSGRHIIGSQNKYVLLFEILEAAKTEDDTTISGMLKGAGINAGFLSADKNYLYRLLLRALNAFHDSKTTNLEIKETLKSIEILFHKGLYEQCLKLISRAEKLADECENFQLMIDILTWKKKCSGYSSGLKKAAEVNKAIEKYVLLINNFKRITDLYYQTYILQANNEKLPRKKVIEKFKRILAQPEMKSEKEAMSFSARIFFHLIHSNYFFIVDDKEKEFRQLQKLVDMISSSGSYAAENPLDFISIYNRFLSIKKFMAEPSFFSDIKFLKEFAQKVHIRKEVVIQRVFIHSNTHELEYYLISNQIQKAVELSKSIEKGIAGLSFDIEPFHMVYLYYLLGTTAVFSGNFRKALFFVNTIQNNFDFDSRPQVFMRTRVLNAILHFELKNFSLVSTCSDQILSEDKLRRILLGFEKKLLSALKKISVSQPLPVKEELAIFNQLMPEVKKYKEKHKAFKTTLIENYEKWIYSKTKRKLVCEIPFLPPS